MLLIRIPKSTYYRSQICCVLSSLRSSPPQSRDGGAGGSDNMVCEGNERKTRLLGRMQHFKYSHDDNEKCSQIPTLETCVSYRLACMWNRITTLRYAAERKRLRRRTVSIVTSNARQQTLAPNVCIRIFQIQ